MNQTKKNILVGEKLHAQKQDFLNRINNMRSFVLPSTSFSDAGIQLLLDITKVELEDHIANISDRLAKERKRYIIEFEAESKETNENIGKMVIIGSQYAGKDPLAITDKIQELIAEYKTQPEQERKNDIFYEISDHIKILKPK